MEAKCNLPEDTRVFAAVLFQDKIYVALNGIGPPDPYSMLYCSSGQLLSWNQLTIFHVVGFGLGAYQSKLVRVGGAVPVPVVYETSCTCVDEASFEDEFSVITQY